MDRYPKLLALVLVIAVLLAAGAAYSQISGHLTVCRGASRTILAGTPGGGVWSSGDITRATINSITGEVTGVAAGTATISYTDPSSTVHTAVVTVNNYVMSAIGFSMGSDIRCTGGVPASCTVSPMNGNNWSSSDPSIATVNTGGLVVPSASNSGTVTISYRHGYGNCYVTREITVNPTPTVSVTNPVCVGITQTATGTPVGGTWSSSNTSVGTINSTTGVLSTFTGGGTYIRYTVGSCQSQTFLTVAAAPAAITGSTTICVGNSATLSSASSGGTWSSSDPSVATIGSSSGVVAGVSTGTTTISYIVGSGCFRTVVVTVNAGPSASVGPDEVCAGQAISLTNATGGGSWSSSNTSRATVTTYGGTVVGVSAGTVNISYRVGGGCSSVKTITVNATMAAISGGPNVCEGATVSLSHAMGGGTWAASNSHATVDATTGVVTGVTAGALNITYTASPGCVKAKAITVKSVPAAIVGTLTVCPGATTALSSASGGGVWSSSNTSVATVSSTGVVTGVSGGTATITYTVTSWGCSTTAVVTVSSTGGSISGSTILCLGTGTTLTSSTTGGTWSSSNISVATIDASTGAVISVSAGTTTISYNTGGGCLSIVVLTVNNVPSSITGTASVCVGSATTLSNSVGGGTWSSGNSSVATITSSTGVVSGVAAGTAVITYAIGACSVTTVVTVQAAPGSITGSLSLCEGQSGTLSNTASGGAWSSGNPAVSIIESSSGVVNAVASGTATISYVLGGMCVSTAVVTVSPAPSAITGTLSVCAGSSTTLSNAISGGVWTSGNTSVASVGSSTGVVTGIAAGAAAISYAIGTCAVTSVIIVNSTAGTISGGTILYPTLTATLTATVSGGLWSSSNTSVATVGSATGIVSAIASGTTTITYSTSGCLSTVVVTVLATPAPIGGSTSILSGGTTTLTNPVEGGIWSSSNASVATIGSLTGILTAVSAGTSTISYAIGSSYLVTTVITVTALSSSSSCPGSWTALTGLLRVNHANYGGRVSMTLDDCGAPYALYSSSAHTAYVKKFDGHEFVLVGGAIDPAGGDGDAIAIDSAGAVYVVYSDLHNSNKATVRKYNGSTWEAVGTPGFSSGAAYYSAIGIGAGGMPYIVYNNSAGSGSLTMMKFNGSSWELVGTAGFVSGTFYKLYIDFDSTGAPYVFSPLVESVMKFDGSDWVTIPIDVPAPVLPYYELKEFAVSSSGEIYVSFISSELNYANVIKYDGSSWSELAACPVGAGVYPYDVKLALDSDNQLWAAYFASDLVAGYGYSVSRYNGTEWIPVSERPILAYPGSGFSFYDYFKVDPTGTVYLNFYSLDQYYGMAVVRLQGGQWEFLDGGTKGIDHYGAYPGLVINNAGIPYISYSEGDNFVAVKKFTGKVWEPVGPVRSDGHMDIDSNASYTYIAMSASGTPYVVYAVIDGGIKVKMYDGTNWNSVGSEYINPGGNGWYPRIALDSIGMPYVCFHSFTDGGYKVVKYDGSSWVQIGSILSNFGPNTQIAVKGTTPYIFSWDYDFSSRGTVKKFDGSGWVDVGSGGFTSSSIDGFGIAFAENGTPYVVYGNSSTGNPVSVEMFDGSSWVAVGGSVGSGSYNSAAAICMAGNTPYVVFRDSDHGDTLSVKKFDGSAWVNVGEPGFFFGTSVPYFSGPVTIATYGDSVYVIAQRDAEPTITVMKYAPSTETIFEHSVCVGSSVVLYSPQGGDWMSSDPSIASVNCTGLLTGVSAGTATITYIYDSCYSTSVVTVNASPSAGTITGPSVVTSGSSVSLSASISGGAWSSSDTAVVTVSSVGFVTGVGTGLATISYTVTSGSCSGYAFHTMTVAAARPGTVAVVDAAEQVISVVPNPTKGMFILNATVAGTLGIFSIDGRTLISAETAVGSNAVEMPVGITPGVYLLRFTGDDGSTQTTRLIYQP